MADTLIIIPAYNEGHNLTGVLRDIINQHMDVDILVINDGSADKTKLCANEENVDVISHPFNLGYGKALQTGFKYAVIKKYDYVIQFDGDGQHDSKNIPDMLNELKKGYADIVVGSRFLGKSMESIGFMKKVVIYFFSSLIKFSTGCSITDPTSGFKGLSGRAFKYYSIMDNFPEDFPDADMLIKMIRNRYRVCEIPISARKRTSGKSMHSGLKPAFYMIKVLMSILIVLLSDIFLKGDGYNEWQF